MVTFMDECVYVKIPLVAQAGKSVEEAAGMAIVEHQNKFTFFFERLINIDNVRISVTEGCLEIENVEITDDQGVAEVQFMSSFYAGCINMDSDDWHEAVLPFEIEDGYMIFNVELPRIWRVEL
jgi:hypothetical protein